MRDPLKMEEIPQGIIDDLNEHYNNVTFDLDSDIDTDTVSKKCNYVHKINDELVTEHIVVDSQTYEPVKISCNGYYHMTYIVRGNFNNDGVIIKRVLESGIVVK